MASAKLVRSATAITRVAWVLLVVLAVLNIGRGLFHAFAPDGGAGTVAHLDLSTNAQNIIFLIAMIGIHQVALGLLQLVVAFRARQFVFHAFVIDMVMLLIPLLIKKQPASLFPGFYAHEVERDIVVIVVILLFAARSIRQSR